MRMGQGLNGTGQGIEVGYVGEIGINDWGRERGCRRRHQ